MNYLEAVSAKTHILPIKEVLPLLSSELQDKILKIGDLFKNQTVCIALSGGVDSILVSYFAKAFANETVVIFIDTPTMIPIEKDIAQKIAQILHLEIKIIEINTLQDSKIASNNIDRCYFCKKHIIHSLEQVQHELHFTQIVDGTNYSDLGSIRPGLTALQESHVLSPLAIAEITKSEIREISKKAGLPSAEFPSQACLASRVPFDIPLTPEIMKKIAAGENLVRKILDDFSIPVRVRLHYLDSTILVRLEVGEKGIPLLLEKENRLKILDFFQSLGFIFITIDLAGFQSGSMHLSIK